MEKVFQIDKILEVTKRYLVIKQLGKGAFSRVYLASDRQTYQEVALKHINIQKLIHREKNQEIKNIKIKLIESQTELMKECISEHIVKCHDVINTEQDKVIVLEYCKDGNLYDKIENQQKIQEDEAINIMSQLLKGFATMHQKKVIHRDIKTQNILINQGVYKLSDFGLARSVQKLTKTQQMSVVGTRCTIAPQVIRGQDYSFEADLWSLGVVFYEMLTGQLPFITITQKQIQTCISQFSYNLLDKIFVIDQHKRLKWRELYKIFFNSPQQNKQVENKKQIVSTQNQQSQIISNTKETQILQNQLENKIQKEKQKILIQQRFKSELENLIYCRGQCQLIFQKGILSFQQFNHYAQIQNQLVLVYKLQILSQIVKIVETYKDFMHIQKLGIISKYYDQCKDDLLIKQFNQFCSKIYDLKDQIINKLFNYEQSQTKKRYEKLNKKQKQESMNKYMLFDCQPNQHFQFTEQIFAKLKKYLLNNKYCKQSTMLDNLITFMSDFYKYAIQQCQSRNRDVK